jgi:hypothetical protein
MRENEIHLKLTNAAVEIRRLEGELAEARKEIRRLSSATAAYRLLIDPSGVGRAVVNKPVKVDYSASETWAGVQAVISKLEGNWSFTYHPDNEGNELQFQHWRPDGYMVTIGIPLRLIFDSPEATVNLLTLRSWRSVEVDKRLRELES